MTTVRILRPGVRTTVQDLGRPGYAHLGVPRAGATDRTSLVVANRIVGNEPNAAALEVVLGGLALICSEPTIVAVSGTDAPVRVAGDPAPANEPLTVPRETVVEVGTSRTGVYTYLAFAGGIACPSVLGSRSTDTLAGVGPAPLRVGDELPVGPRQGTPTTIEAPRPHETGPLRIVLGPRDDWFTAGALHTLLTAEWVVTPQCDRTGLRLSGPTLDRRTAGDLRSEGIVAGAIQVPPEGLPIVLLANHPATGGYPVIGVIRATDIDRAAQSRPGQRLRFVASPTR